MFDYKGNGRQGCIEREMVLEVRWLYRNCCFLFHLQWQKKWIIQLATPFQMKMMNHLNPAKDSSSSQPTRKNRHCEKFKWFRDMIPPPLPRTLSVLRPPSHPPQLFCSWVLVCLQRFTHKHAATQKNWLTPQGFDCTTVNYIIHEYSEDSVIDGINVSFLWKKSAFF